MANFDGGDQVDGLFSLTVDYELNHANLETGTAKLVRTKEGDLWTIKTSTSLKSMELKFEVMCFLTLS